MKASSIQKSGQIYGLDILRFVAAFFVVMFHLTYGFWADPRQSGELVHRTFYVYASFGKVFSIGWIGVQIFFVISGFVIALTANGRSPMYFIRRRLLRLLPGIWVCSLLSVPMLYMHEMGLTEIVHRFIDSVFIFPIGPYTANSFWTLPVEMCFYTFIFVVIKTNNFIKLELFSLILTFWSVLFWIGHFLISKQNALFSIIFGMNRLSQLLLLQHGAFFALGILIWLSFKFGINLRRALLMASATAVDIAAILGETYKANSWFDDNQSFTLAASIWMVSLLFFVVSVYKNDVFDRISSKYAEIIRWIGLSTYPLYLIHQPFSESVMGLFLDRGFNPWLVLLIGLLANVLLALVIAMYAEPFVRKHFDQFADWLFKYLPLEEWDLNRSRDPLENT